jgi:VWFA-related protein
MKAGIPRFLMVWAFLLTVIMRLAAQGNPQEQPKVREQQPFKLAVTTRLVLVPVVVSDKHGAHVTGLSAADFEVKEDGTTQKIVRLDELTADAARVQPAVANLKTFTNQVVAEHPKKLVVIALDQVNTPFESARDGARRLVDFLSRYVDTNTLLALVAMQQNGVRVIHSFTADPETLVTAVKKVQSSLSSHDTQTSDISGDNSQADSEALQLVALFNNTDISTATNGNAAVAAARAASAQTRAQVDASRRAQDSLITLEDFQQLALYFGGVPGRKSLIWASTGFPFALGTAPQSSTRGTLFDDWERTFRMLADANISVYPVDIGGLLPGVNANNIQTLNSAAIRTGGPEGGVAARSGQLEAVDSGAFVDPTVGRQQTMRQLADMTGGQAFYNSNDGAELFRRAAEDSQQYYVLAYYTKETGKNGWRKLAVKVARDGVKVRARSGFFFTNAAAESDAARQSEELMAMSSDLNFTSLPVEGKWEQIEPAGNERKLRFVLSVPAGVPFIDTENQNHLNFDFRVVVTDSSGQVAGKIGQRLDTNLPPDEVQRIRSVGLDYLNEVTLAPGQYKVHFVVRDNLRGALGSIVTPLKVE